MIKWIEKQQQKWSGVMVRMGRERGKWYGKRWGLQDSTRGRPCEAWNDAVTFWRWKKHGQSRNTGIKAAQDKKVWTELICMRKLCNSFDSLVNNSWRLCNFFFNILVVIVCALAVNVLLFQCFYEVKIEIFNVYVNFCSFRRPVLIFICVEIFLFTELNINDIGLVVTTACYLHFLNTFGCTNVSDNNNNKMYHTYSHGSFNI